MVCRVCCIKCSICFKHPLVVFGVVGFEQELTAWDESLLQNVEKLLLHQPAFVVSGFGPWVGAEQVEA